MSQPDRETHSDVCLDGYEVLEEIGAGGFSVVYRARQIALNREVAIKVLNTGFSSDAERRTFERECHALGRVSHHPNIVTVFNDAMTTTGRPAIVMELYGANYRDRLAMNGPLPAQQVLDLGIRLAGALQNAHEHDVLHRDLKPHNIFVSAYGEPALGDFGISTIDDERSQHHESGLSIAYSAPEILEQEAPSVAGDVYALAVTLFQLIGGRTPFASDAIATTIRKILTEEPPRLTVANLPAGLNRVLQGALAKSPDERPDSMAEFAEQLREVQRRNGLTPTPIPQLQEDLVARRSGSFDSPGGLEERRQLGPSSSGSGPVSYQTASPSREVHRANQAHRPTQGMVRTDRATGNGASTPAPSSSDVSRAPERTVTRQSVDRVEQGHQPASLGDEEASGARKWVGRGGLALLLLAVVVGLVVVNADDDPAEPPPTPLTSAPPEPLLGALPVPTGVRVVSNADGYRVSYRMPDDAESVEIDVVSGAAADGVISAEGEDIDIESDAGSVCVVLRAIGGNGRLSADTDPTCSN